MNERTLTVSIEFDRPTKSGTVHISDGETSDCASRQFELTDRKWDELEDIRTWAGTEIAGWIQLMAEEDI